MDSAMVVIFGGAILIYVIIVLCGAFVCPNFNEEIIQAYELMSSRTRRKSFLYGTACLARSIRENTVGTSKKYDASQEEEEKEKVDWKCPNCGRYNHSFQEMCACGQDRDDVKL